MSPPRLEACYFATSYTEQWRRLAAVLRWSAAVHCPSWRVNIVQLTPQLQPTTHGVLSDQANTQKLDQWTAAVDASADGEQLVLIDVDTMILRPLDEVWQRDFDVAVTTRADGTTINGGVVFVRSSPAARAFMRAWQTENRRLLGDRERHLRFRHRWNGMNQAAFGALFEEQRLEGARLLGLPCAEWNLEDSTWSHFDPAVTRIVHVKSGLRRALFHNGPRPPAIKRLMGIWQQIDRLATEAQPA